MDKEPTSAISMRIPTALKLRLEEAAELDRRTLTGIVVAITSKWLDGQMHQPIERPAPPAPKPKAPPLPFKRPPGRMRSANWGLHDQAYVTAIKKHLAPDGERSLTEMFKLFNCDPLEKPMFAQALEANFLIVGWRPMIRTSDQREVWLGPEHPHSPVSAT